MSMHYLSRMGAPGAVKRVTTRYVELVFLHLVGSAGHVVCSGASGV
jgi:hypothetical protein